MARSALKAAQAGLAEGLNRLMVATTVRAGSGGAVEGGESPVFSGGAGAFSSPADSFLPGGFGAGGRGDMGIVDIGGSRGSGGSTTILPSVNSVGGSYILPILPDYKSRITTPLTFDMGGGARGQGTLTYKEAYGSSHGGGYADDDGSQGECSSQSLDMPRPNSQGEGGGATRPLTSEFPVPDQKVRVRALTAAPEGSERLLPHSDSMDPMGLRRESVVVSLRGAYKASSRTGSAIRLVARSRPTPSNPTWGDWRRGPTT